jgi:DNA-binding NarL/FixJ family response regulator
VNHKTAAVDAMPVVILADDLIWSSRLHAAVEKAGTTGHATRSAAGLLAALQDSPAGSPVLIDLNGRGYDGVEQVRVASEAGHTVVAVGQHEDLELRRRALAAGARRVFSYNKLFAEGPSVVAALLEGRF